MCVCNLSLPPNDISRRRKRGYYRIRYWVNSSIVYTYYKESRFALFFFLFSPSHKRISLLLYVTAIIFTRRLRESHSRCLTYKCSSRKDWFVTVRVKFLLVSFWNNDSTFGDGTSSKPPSLSPFYVLFSDVWCIWCVYLLYVFSDSLSYISFFLTRLAYVRNYALN